MQIDPAECHPAMDYNAHLKSYNLFIKTTIGVAIFVAALMAFLAIFVA